MISIITFSIIQQNSVNKTIISMFNSSYNFQMDPVALNRMLFLSLLKVYVEVSIVVSFLDWK